MSNSPNYHDFGPPSLNDQSNNNNQYNLSMLYFGFLVVATAGLILAIYHCIVFNFCTEYPSSLLLRHSTSSSGGGGSGSTPSHHGFNASKLKVVELESVLFKYNKKEKGVQLQTEQEEEEEECVVCLSVFEEGEDVRKLVKCKHCFHAPCIDMWLYSHFDCPLCRATLGDAAAAAAAAATGVSVPPSEGNSGARYSDSGVLPV